MSDVEEFLSQMLPRYARAVDAMHNGDPALFVEEWSRRDPVTLLGAGGVGAGRVGERDRGPAVGRIAVFQWHAARL
jgi:hypothetical protein